MLCEAPATQPPLTGVRILVVEDDAIIAEYEELALTEFGAEVIGRVDNEAAAFALMPRDLPDVVVLDVNLRGPAP